MAKKVETGAVDQRPEDLRDSDVCLDCGAEVSEDGEHDCEDS